MMFIKYIFVCSFKIILGGTSLLVQWLRIHPAVQGHRLDP